MTFKKKKNLTYILKKQIRAVAFGRHKLKTSIFPKIWHLPVTSFGSSAKMNSSEEFHNFQAVKVRGHESLGSANTVCIYVCLCVDLSLL